MNVGDLRAGQVQGKTWRRVEATHGPVSEHGTRNAIVEVLDRAEKTDPHQRGLGLAARWRDRREDSRAYRRRSGGSRSVLRGLLRRLGRLLWLVEVSHRLGRRLPRKTSRLRELALLVVPLNSVRRVELGH